MASTNFKRSLLQHEANQEASSRRDQEIETRQIDSHHLMSLPPEGRLSKWRWASPHYTFIAQGAPMSKVCTPKQSSHFPHVPGVPFSHMLQRLSLDSIQFTNFRKWLKPECRKWKASALVTLNQLSARLTAFLLLLSELSSKSLFICTVLCLCESSGKVIRRSLFWFHLSSKIVDSLAHLRPFHTAPWNLAVTWYQNRYFSRRHSIRLQQQKTFYGVQFIH